MLLLSSADLFLNQFFSKNSYRNTVRVSNSLDPDQDRSSVGHDPDPNCFVGYQEMTKVAAIKEKS